MREFIVDLSQAKSFDDFVAAFNDGFCHHVSGHWGGNLSWDAFHDYLSWPEEESFRLTFRGWESSPALSPQNRQMIQGILGDNPHVHAHLA